MQYEAGTYKDVNGTSLRGYVLATRATLEEVFGEPTYDTDDATDKVTVEWVLKFADGESATIYDWKRYEEGTPAMDELYQWHIGGMNPIVVGRIQSHVLRHQVQGAMSR